MSGVALLASLSLLAVAFGAEVLELSLLLLLVFACFALLCTLRGRLASLDAAAATRTLRPKPTVDTEEAATQRGEFEQAAAAANKLAGRHDQLTGKLFLDNATSTSQAADVDYACRSKKNSLPSVCSDC